MPNTREKLIELLQCSPTDVMGNHGVGALADHLIANGVTILTMPESKKINIKLPKEIVVHPYKPKWIPVTERLPEESGEYLAYCGEYDGICVLYYEVLKTKGKWRTKWKDDVTHWMPLPEAPKGE